MRIYTSIVAFCMSITLANAQPHNIKNLDIYKGLSDNYVMSITQDCKGFIWIATDYGLNRFDGTSFRVFNKETGNTPSPNSISANELNKVYADKFDPVIWVATQRSGLNMFDLETETFTHFKHSPSNSKSIITNDITDIVNSKSGNLWISTYHQGVELFDKKTQEFTHFNMSTHPELTNENTWSVNEDSQNNLYIGHVNAGLSILDLETGKVKNFRHDPNDKNSLPGNGVNTIYIGDHDQVWLGTDNGLALYNPFDENFISFQHDPNNPNSILGNQIFTICSIGTELWIGVENGGVSIIDVRRELFNSRESIAFKNITESYDDSGLSSKTVREIFKDSYGNIWLGTWGRGIDFISHIPRYFNVWGYPYKGRVEGVPSLSNKVAWGITMDNDESIWIGTDGGGIDVYTKEGKYKRYTKEAGHLSDNAILCALTDSKGDLWFGTFAGGLLHYSQKSQRFSNPYANMITNDVRTIYEDSEQNIWIGTSEGLFRIDRGNGRLHEFTTANSPLHENLVRSITQDSKGNMWIGTFGEGLIVINHEMDILTLLNTNNKLLSNTVNHLYKDTENRIWAATGEGLILFPDPSTPDSCKIFTQADGLLSSNIRAITEDKNQTIWISTNNGISRLTPNYDKFFNYDHFDGLPYEAFMSGSVAQSSDGTIYFGSQNGLCHFLPTEIPTDISLPPTVISSFRIFGDYKDRDVQIEIPVKDNITLAYHQNTFNLTFNVLDYAFNDKIEFTYRLHGTGDQWFTLRAGKENSVDFRNIPYGNYAFQVRTKVKNQEWSDEIASLAIRIKPPIWLTFVAKLLYFLIAIAIVSVIAFFYRRKLELENKLALEQTSHQREQEISDERLRFFTNITHELRSPLTLILGPLEDLHLDKSVEKQHAGKITVIYNNARRLLNLINQLLEFRRTETQNKRLNFIEGDISITIKEVLLKYHELESAENVDIVFKLESKDNVFSYDPNAITIIIDNLISNALKFTDKGEIIVTLREFEDDDDHYAEILVRDTGTGIAKESIDRIFDRYYQVDPTQSAGTGIGLALVKNLVLLHQGTISVESEAGEFTQFKIRLLKNYPYPTTTLDTAQLEIQPIIDEPEEDNEEHEEYGDLEQTEDSKKTMVLVIEDNEDICNYICQSLIEDDYDVISAGDGKEGLEMAFEHTPDIIVSDIMMPEPDGIELCKIVKQDVRTSHIPVILLTAKDTTQDRIEGYQAEADSYITKPFSSTLLKSRIENILETRRRLAKSLKQTISIRESYSESLSKLDSDFLDKLTQIIEDNMDSDKVDVGFLANSMHMSHSTLYRKVKALTDLSANEFIRKIRITNAEKLLLTGRYNISEVAYMVGINSPRYFRKCFREEFGMTPSEYLRNASKGK